ncbi:XRE family transcriptional regulator [Lentzea sp. NPDC042327]|uniref:XRE family transcriptional regulator n=1 Tax=Lentzea sp. NPDC042327 TaxID=3154801 RepID=UPI0033CB6CC2
MFTPSRLTLARTRRGLTAAELARKAGLTTSAVIEYERGQRRPAPATREVLATALGFPATFLSAPEPALPQSISTTRPEAVCVAQLAIEFSGWLERMFVLPQPNLPRPRTGPGEVRRQWRMSTGPAPNMVQLLEFHGVRVFSVDCPDVGAFSCWHNGTPYVFLSPATTAERARFDAAAELGTLLGHEDAREFAAEFLLPAGQLQGTHHRHWHVDKKTFDERARGVATVPAETEGMPRRETSKLLTKVFRALRENGTTPHQVARELTLGLEDLNGLVVGLVLTALPGGGEPGPVRRARLTLVH